MEGTNIGMQKWAFAIYMMVTSPQKPNGNWD